MKWTTFQTRLKYVADIIKKWFYLLLLYNQFTLARDQVLWLIRAQWEPLTEQTTFDFWSVTREVLYSEGTGTDPIIVLLPNQHHILTPVTKGITEEVKKMLKYVSC